MRKLIFILLAGLTCFGIPEITFAQTAYTTTKVTGDLGARVKRDTLTNTDTVLYEVEIATSSDVLTWEFECNRTSGTANGVIYLFAKSHVDATYNLISTDTLANSATQKFKQVLQRNDYRYWKVLIPQGSTAVVRHDIYLLNREAR